MSPKRNVTIDCIAYSVVVSRGSIPPPFLSNDRDDVRNGVVRCCSSIVSCQWTRATSEEACVLLMECSSASGRESDTGGWIEDYRKGVDHRIMDRREVGFGYLRMVMRYRLDDSDAELRVMTL